MQLDEQRWQVTTHLMAINNQAYVFGMTTSWCCQCTATCQQRALLLACASHVRSTRKCRHASPPHAPAVNRHYNQRQQTSAVEIPAHKRRQAASSSIVLQLRCCNGHSVRSHVSVITKLQRACYLHLTQHKHVRRVLDGMQSCHHRCISLAGSTR